jgi:hypothetical protein
MSSRERLEALAKGNSDLVGDAPAARSQADRDVREKPSRVRGVFNGTNKKLDVLSEIPGYVIRWFNDMPGRADRAQTGGWEFVTAGEVAQSDSNKVVERNSDVGNKVRAIVGTTEQNEPLYAYLMKIKKEWFEEDQMDGKTKIMASEAEMVRNGGLNTDRIGEKYLPDQRRQALSVRRDSFERGGSVS